MDRLVAGQLGRLCHVAVAVGDNAIEERTWAVNHPRMLAIYLSRKHTAASFSEMCKHFGGKSRATAVAAARELIERIERETLE